MSILWLFLAHISLRGVHGGREEGRRQNWQNTWTNGGQSSDYQLANLWDRRWRWIVFCLVNPRPLRFLACNTSPSISSNRSPLLACIAQDCFACSLNMFIAHSQEIGTALSKRLKLSSKKFIPQSLKFAHRGFYPRIYFSFLLGTKAGGGAS